MTFMYQGAQVRRSTETRDRQLAKRIHDKVLGEIAEGKWFDRKPDEEITFRELMQRYLDEHSAVNKAPVTYRRDKIQFRHLVGFFGDRVLAHITPKLIVDYKRVRRVAGVSPKTVNNELTMMSHAFTLAMREWEWARENPVRRVSRERVRNTIERWLTREEEDRLLEHSVPWLQSIIMFAVQTGLRQSEILDLQWSRVDLFRRTITILEQKNGGKDTLPVNGRALEVLKEQAKLWQSTSPYVFPNSDGRRRSSGNLLRAFYKALKRAEIKALRFHDLRHTFATRLVQAGVDLYAVQKLGRWRTLSMVMRYGHHYAESLRPGIEVLDKLPVGRITKLSQCEAVGSTACG